MRLLKRKEMNLQDELDNAACLSLLNDIKVRYPNMKRVIVIVEQGKETYWDCAGYEPAQAILSLDQLHHRIQHEGL